MPTSVPYRGETKLHIHREEVGRSMVGEEVDIRPLSPSRQESIDDLSENRKVEGSRRQYHLRAIAEIEECASQYKAEKITIPLDLRQSLPPAVEALLSRLECSSPDDRIYVLSTKDLQSPGFGSLFGGSADPDFDGKFGQIPKEWAAGVRLLTMTAAGSCKTLKFISFSDLNLTIQELKALLQPLQSSSILETLYMPANGIGGTKEGCKVLTDFLKVNRSVRCLGMSERDLYIRHYLVAYGHPTLERLSLFRTCLEEEDKAGIIQACPNLQQMLYITWEVKDEQTARMYAQVLIAHQSFRDVNVRGPAGPVSSLLISAFTGARSATSLTYLWIFLTGSYRWSVRNVLQSVILANRDLEYILFDKVYAFSEDWRGVFRSLKQSSAPLTLSLQEASFDENEGFNGSAWDEMVALVQESSKLTAIEVGKTGEYQHDLCTLIAAVTSNKRLSDFSLRGFQISSDESRALVSLIQKNTPLTSLTLSQITGPNWEEVFSSLRYNTTLDDVSIFSITTLDDSALEAFLTALQTNTALKRYYFGGTNWSEEGKAEIVEYAFQEKERQGAVTYAFVTTCTKDKPRVIRSLQQNAILQHLYLSFMASDSKDEFDARAWEALEALLGGSCTLESLTVFGNDEKTFEHNVRRLFEVIPSSKSLRSLTLRDLHVSSDESKALACLIKDSTSLAKMTLVHVRVPHWEMFFRSLRDNVALQALELRAIDTLDDGALKELLAALQVNSSLQTIDVRLTNWGDEGKDAIVREALEQKGRRENYMAIMRAALGQEKFDAPNAGRLFLCGFPCAGKTQLRMALTQVASLRANNGGPVRSCVQSMYNLRRTEGIEIELVNIDSLQVAIWDLGGQDIFRTLQDVLFPKLNLACVFLLVFSPFDKNLNRLKPALSDELHRQLIQWLRFIASNSQITGYILPQVKVVISHRDKLDMALPDSPRLWAEDVINCLRLQFAGILDIDETVFCTNSKGLGEDVEEVLNHTIESFKHLLSNKVLKVPATCLTLGSVLAKRGRYSQPKAKSDLYKELFTCPNPCFSLGSVLARSGITAKSKIEPILPSSEFFELCRREVVSLKDIKCSEVEGRKLMFALAEYLHDAGNIIQFAMSGLVVVDPNWFTYSFMGRLIGAGHNFEHPLVCVDHYKHQKDGHLSTAAFKELLRKFAQILRDEGYCTVEEDLLEMLMTEMDLCFPVPQASCYFAPAVFAEEKHKRSSEGRRQLPAWRCVAERSNMGHDIKFVGVRVQCQDRIRTVLTPSFFPRFQVHFRNLLISSRGLREDQIDCDYNLMYIIVEEYEVYVENDGSVGDHIDVLVRSPNSRSETFKFVQQNVVKEMQDFCASSKGCPGVALVAGVLRTDCVRNLTLSAHRDEHQAILIEELKGKWKEYILNRDVKDNTIWEEGKLANYHYTWPTSIQAKLKETWESARDLLTDEDYLEVLTSVKATAELLGKQLQDLKDIEKEIKEEVKVRCSEAGSSSRQMSIYQHSRPAASLPSSQDRSLQRGFSDVMIGHNKTQYAIWKLGQTVNEVREDVQQVKHIVKGIQRDVIKVQCYQQEILETMVSMNGKLDELTGVLKPEVPSRPYFTRSDVKWTHRISSAVYVGRAMTLHFMCEERSGNHLVGNQPGYPITVSKDNAEVFRFLCMNSVRILWYLLKAGVHVAAGLGNVIPDLEGGGATTLLTASAVGNVLMGLESAKDAEGKIVDSDHKFDQTSVGGEAWQYLKQLFLEPLKGRCAEYFLLYRVRYATAQANSGHAWLCKECLERGRQMNTVLMVDG